MYIAYTPEQEALRAELRAYFARAHDPRGRGRGARAATPAARHCLEAVRKMGRDGWLGIGWPTEYGGQGRGARRAVHLLRRGLARAAPRSRCSPSTRSARRSWQFGTEEQKRVLPAAHPARASCTSPIGYTEPQSGTDLASLQTTRGARRRRVGDQRPEDLHQPGRLRRLHLAGGPHRPRRPEAQGHLDLRGAHHRRPASRTRPSTRMVERRDHQHLLRRRAGARRRR